MLRFLFHSVCLTFVSLSFHTHLFTRPAYRCDRCALVLVMPVRPRFAISGILAGRILGFCIANFFVKFCTAKLCPENQNKTYRDQSYPKAFPLLNKRESNFPCSLAQVTPDNKATLQHTLCFSRSGLSQRRSLGIQFKYCSKVTKTKEGFLSKLQTGFQS